MWKYRYRREVIPDAAWETRCNELGEEGWSLIGAPLYEPTDAWLCFFKRTVSDREQAYAAIHRETTPEERAQIEAFAARRRDGG